jgi:hypothetical protein
VAIGLAARQRRATGSRSRMRRPGKGTFSKVLRAGVGLCRCPTKYILKALHLDAVLTVYFHKNGSDSHAIGCRLPRIWGKEIRSLSHVRNHELMIQEDRRPKFSTDLNTKLLHTVHVLCRGVDQPYVLTIRTCRQAAKGSTPRVSGNMRHKHPGSPAGQQETQGWHTVPAGSAPVPGCT